METSKRPVVRVGAMEFDRAAYGQTEAADMLGITRQLFAQMVREQRVHAVRAGRRVLIPVTEIARLLGEGGGNFSGDAA